MSLDAYACAVAPHCCGTNALFLSRVMKLGRGLRLARKYELRAIVDAWRQLGQDIGCGVREL